MVPSPWTALAERPELILDRRPLVDPGRYYDAEEAIVVRAGLKLEEERRVLWHELVHADRRDTIGHSDPGVEQLVDRLAAEDAMPWFSLRWAWDEATDLDEMAGLLKLPIDWVHKRLMRLHPAQKALLRVRVESWA